MNNTSAQNSAPSLISKWIHHVNTSCLLLLCLYPLALKADFLPMPLAAESFNQDIVVERSAPGPVLPATTASMDTGWTNSGFSWYERGYNRDWPATGLRPPGWIITSDLAADHLYQLAPDYRTNNVALIDQVVTNATLRVEVPAPYAALSLLVSGMHNGGLGSFTYTVFFQDGSSQSRSATCRDWMDTGYAACATDGRIDVRTFNFAQLNTGFPKLFTVDIPLVNSASAVTHIELRHVAGVRTAVFALSGAIALGGTFDPVTISGYNADVVVEAAANRPRHLTSATTASMENGFNNTLRTWFEQGYAPFLPPDGLPAPSSLVTNGSATDHVYLMPGAYNANNAMLLDSQSPAASLVPSTPVTVKALSFLTASAGGPSTNRCVVRHADGSTQTNLLVSPDWLGTGASAAWTAGACLNLNSSLIYSPANGGPNLYGVDLLVTNTASPVTRVDIAILNPSSSTCAAFFALSGQNPSGLSERAVLTIRLDVSGNVLIQSTLPGTLESTSQLNGVDTAWSDEGPIANNRTVAPGPGTRLWRVRH